MPKFYKGNIPVDKKWSPTFCLLDSDSKKWIVFAHDSGEDFISLKIVFIGKRPNKANFWVSYHRDRCFFMFRRDFLTLLKHEVSLVKALSKKLREIYGEKNPTKKNSDDYIDEIYNKNKEYR